LNYYVTLTTKCNLRCTYCYGKSCEDFGSDFGDLQIDYTIPTTINYELTDLVNFVRQDPYPTIIFYGGEPFLEIEKIKKIMDEIEADRFIIQTNGLFLDRLDPEYARRLDTILVSIDGNEALTDRNRGNGVYRKVMENLKLLKINGFDGELIPRMTISSGTEIDRQVLSLVSNKELSFKSVHWQLDALFWQNDFDRTQFRAWSENAYNPAVKRLVEMWIERMETFGEVLKLYPILGVMRSLLFNEESKLRCGAGWNTFNIQTDGRITPCPVMAGMKDFYLGSIWDTNPSDLKDSVFVRNPCTECDDYTLCGGRCLYANATKLWGEEGFRQVCGTVASLIASVRNVESRVRQLIHDGRVRIEDFNYGEYNSCEIIP